MVRRQRVSGGRSQRREIPGLESSGSWDPDVRLRNERSPGAEDKDRTAGQKTPGLEVIRMERRIIRRRPGAATENQSVQEAREEDQGQSGRRERSFRVRIASGRGTSGDAKSGCNVRSTLRPDSRLT